MYNTLVLKRYYKNNNFGENGLDNPAFVPSPGDDVKEKNGVVPEVLPEKKTDLDEEDDKPRAEWGNGLEFLMSCIAMSVGLGNIWRFPFTAQRNGGGAFLIPYLIVLTLIGRPLYFMEMALGQFSSKGNVKMFERLSPVLKGIGYGQLIGSICVATYYCCLMAITLFYLAHSFTSNLPWTQCMDSWTTYLDENNMICIPSINTTTTTTYEDTDDANDTRTRISSSEMWFKREVLREADDISEGIGSPDWRLTLCLLASWFITFLVSVRGVKSSGKASYFLALFPYVIMFTLLIRAATLEGAADGMFYFIDTDWNKLLEADVWYAAVTQCFFSLNVGFGSIIMYSSYNNFHHPISRDAWVVTTLDTFTSLLSGVTIFGILGNLAHELGVPAADVVSGGGTGLAFISYPEAIAKFEAVPWLFAILFFFMLFVLGVGSLVALQSCANTVIKDAFPYIAAWKISAGTAMAGFLIGLIYVTPGGQYVLDLVDHFGGTFIIFVFAILEVAVVTWLYGIEHFCLDLEFMTGSKVGAFWRFTWAIVMPALLIVIFIYFVATLTPLTYGLFDLYYPVGLTAFGWCIFGIGVLQMIGWLLYYLWANRIYPYNKIICKTFSTKTWGPEGKKRYREWKAFKDDYLSRKYPRQGNWFQRKLAILIGR